MERRKDGQIGKWRETKVERRTERQTDSYMVRRTECQTDRQADRMTDRCFQVETNSPVNSFTLLVQLKIFFKVHIIFFFLRSLFTSVPLQMMITFAYLWFMIFCVRSFTTLNTWKRATFQSYKDNSRMFEYKLIKLLIYSTTTKEKLFCSRFLHE